MSPERRLSRSRLAWALAAAQIVILTSCVLYIGAAGIWSASEIAVPGVMAFAAIGALIASRRTISRLGWWLLLSPVPITLNVLVITYADISVLHHLALPFAGFAQWIVNWAWTPFVGSFPVILVRFPDGRVSRRWRFADGLAAVGTIALAVGLAVTSGSAGNNVFTSAPIQSVGGVAMVAGLMLLAAAMVAAAGSLVERYRRGDRKVRGQLKWILLAAVVVAIASVYMAVVEVAFRVPLGDAMLPSTVVLVLVPIAIGVAVLHYQLFDIDFIVNRTLVYVIVTAVLGGLYIGVIELMQRLFVLYTGERSDTAIVITAFVVAAAFTPLQKTVDRAVERRFGGRDAAGRVDAIRSSMQTVIRVIDPNREARWLVDELVVVFEAEGGALYLHDHDRSRPFHVHGHLGEQATLEIPIRHEDRDMGRLMLGRRRGGVDYSVRDVQAVRAAAAALGEALDLATELGHLDLGRAAADRSRGAMNVR